ncbi:MULTISPECIES: SCP2 sterol-binding domain-containing protein [unclassified Nocardiopsis]|uniref:SCP2 sterol-binding domain-containing protein n=1 Tax=unclassified Nocardiopsis TaxID=2649073 RepID=UPI001357A539|nr:MULTISPECIES: SCP2 sterol-binding domain-containing protein [unclassified Nocardiopsis]
MSSIDACLAGIEKVNQRILDQPEEERRRHIRERSLSVVVPDLATAFDMRLTLDGLVDVAPRPVDQPAPRPQVRVTVDSDDLVALAEERMDAARALLGRRVRVDASVGDLLRLRRLL